MIDLNTDVHSQDENTKRITRKKTGKFSANRTQMCGKGVKTMPCFGINLFLVGFLGWDIIECSF